MRGRGRLILNQALIHGNNGNAHRHSSNRTADMVAASADLHDLNYSALTGSNGQNLIKLEEGRETALSADLTADNHSVDGVAVSPFGAIYKPKSELLVKKWPIGECVLIEYADKQVISKIYSPSIIRKSAGSHLKHSANMSMSDMRSLRSRDAAIIGSRLSVKASENLL